MNFFLSFFQGDGNVVARTSSEVGADLSTGEVSAILSSDLSAPIETAEENLTELTNVDGSIITEFYVFLYARNAAAQAADPSLAGN